MRDTHQIIWSLSTPQLYTISELTTPEMITQRKLNNYDSTVLKTKVSSAYTPPTQPLFIPDDANDHITT